jgi:hypothetical protein
MTAGRSFAISRPDTPEFYLLISTLFNPRAQGMPGAGCARSLVCKMKKHTSVVTTVTPENARHSPRNGFNGFLRALLGEPGFLVTVACEFPRQLDASVGASGPHDFAVRVLRCSSQSATRVHRIPPRVRDDREPPLCGTGLNRSIAVSTWPSSKFRKSGNKPRVLPVLVHRLPLLDKGGHALGPILQREGGVKEIAFEFEPFG